MSVDSLGFVSQNLALQNFLFDLPLLQLIFKLVFGYVLVCLEHRLLVGVEVVSEGYQRLLDFLITVTQFFLLHPKAYL